MHPFYTKFACLSIYRRLWAAQQLSCAWLNVGNCQTGPLTFVYPFQVSTSKENTATNWVAIWALFLSGCTLAAHVGKIPAALPLLVQEFDLTLAQTGNLVSIYALLIAFGALLIGILVARIGYVPFAIAGLSFCMLGSFSGAFVTSVTGLMLSRVIEGLGWIVGVVALPTLLSALAAPKDRPVVMGMWAAFMPVGTCTMLFLAPLLQAIGGWRLAWVLAAILSMFGVITVAVICRQQRNALRHLRDVNLVGKLSDLRSLESLSVLLCFMCYSFQYVALTSYLPTLLVQDSGMPLAKASYWAALVMLANAVGNVAAGWFVNAGFKHHHILACASLLMGLFSWIALSFPATPVRIIAAILMTAAGGVIPGTLFTTAALLASSAAGVGIIVGFMLMGTGFGQLLGPIAMTRVVEWSGHWYAGGLMSFFVGVLGVLFARWLSGLPAMEKN